ncbi:CoB--CoM heterodisulfide reductase iron-sulfur subunit C [uncultured archaeon]|nr:CoB--CoM heterodisulfide reductase iron-sulfur subunit C [uncultured archaeon]
MTDEFRQKVLKLAGSEVQTCIQCGTCSASCPTASLMNPSIRKLIKLCLEGRKDEALNNDTLWLCTSCLLCTVRCPRSIRPKAVVSALKELAEQQGIRGGGPSYEQLFLEQIRDYGRIAELPLSGKFLLVFPQGIVQSMQMGLELAQRGKIGLEIVSIKGQDEVKRIIEELSK